MEGDRAALSLMAHLNLEAQHVRELPLERFEICLLYTSPSPRD